MTSDNPPQPTAKDTRSGTDRRLYVPYPEGWSARVKQGWDAEYCFSKQPGDDHFHQFMAGEIYLQRADEKYCLTCALRDHILTEDRLHWQHRDRHPPPPSPTSEGL